MTTQLTLLQVDFALPPKDQRKLLIGKQVPGSLELDEELDTISTHWPATAPPNPQNLHIIVELPSGKCCVHWVSEISLTVLFFSFYSSRHFLCPLSSRIAFNLRIHFFSLTVADLHPAKRARLDDQRGEGDSGMCLTTYPHHQI